MCRANGEAVEGLWEWLPEKDGVDVQEHAFSWRCTQSLGLWGSEIWLPYEEHGWAGGRAISILLDILKKEECGSCGSRRQCQPTIISETGTLPRRARLAPRFPPSLALTLSFFLPLFLFLFTVALQPLGTY